MAGGGRGEVLAALLTSTGGLILAAGSPLEFVRASGFGFTETIDGLDVIEGKLFLGAGVAFVAAGFVLGLVRSATLKLALAFVGILASVFVFWVAVVDAITLGDDLPEELAESVDFSLGIGLLAGMVGSGLALLGSGIAVFVAEARGRGSPPPPAEPDEVFPATGAE